jgi:hypothetical protein
MSSRTIAVNILSKWRGVLALLGIAALFGSSPAAQASIETERLELEKRVLDIRSVLQDAAKERPGVQTDTLLAQWGNWGNWGNWNNWNNWANWGNWFNG